MKRFIFAINPIVYIVAILLLLTDFISAYSVGGCLDCEPSVTMNAITNAIRWSGRLLIVYAVVVSIVKHREKRAKTPPATTHTP